MDNTSKLEQLITVPMKDGRYYDVYPHQGDDSQFLNVAKSVLKLPNGGFLQPQVQSQQILLPDQHQFDFYKANFL
jgi:hypothetical protein